MKKALFIALLAISMNLSAQTPVTLLYEKFETGGTSFNLNTVDLGGAAGTAGYNEWIINNSYNGGNGQLVCLGFPFNFTVPNTSQQPAGVTGGLTTNYMHIVSDAGQASGISNSCFQAADGICSQNETNFSAMNQDVSTVGYDSVTVSFLWLCSGGTNIYGEVYYSTNSGNTWSLISTPVSQYKNQSTWAQQSITLSQFAQQATLRFAFRFVNSNSASATEPGFGIDEFLITAKNATAPPVAAFSVSDSTICEGSCVNFNDLSTGNPTSYFWVFQGASTAFSTQQNPAGICYNSPGIYEVTLIVSGASGSDTLTVNSVTVYPTPQQPVITFNVDTLFATPGFAFYQWYLNGVAISGANDSLYVVLVDGTYSVEVTDSNGCSVQSLNLNYTTGISENNFNNQFYVSPNPSSENVVVRGVALYQNLQLINLQGKIIKTIYPEKQNEVQLRLSGIAKGIYVMKGFLENGTTHNLKLIVQ